MVWHHGESVATLDVMPGNRCDDELGVSPLCILVVVSYLWMDAWISQKSARPTSESLAMADGYYVG
jgi:hypothetical protein